MLLGEAITAVRTEGGFDVSSTNSSTDVITGWIWQAVNAALGESKWRKQSRELGPTVADQAQYLLPDEVVDVASVRVNGGRPWALASSLEDVWQVQAGDGYVRNAPGVFFANFEADTDSVVELWPVPTEAGLSIEAIAAILYADTAGADTTTTLPLPQDLVRPIAVNGAVAIGLALLENRHGDAREHQGKADAATATLKRRANSRVGSGPSMMRIWQP